MLKLIKDIENNINSTSPKLKLKSLFTFMYNVGRKKDKNRLVFKSKLFCLKSKTILCLIKILKDGDTSSKCTNCLCNFVVRLSSPQGLFSDENVLLET